MPRLDRVTRGFWRAVGRPVDLGGEHAWLEAPVSSGPVVGDGWLHEAAAALGGAVTDRGPTAGLIEDLSVLDGPGFHAADLHAEVRDFYEHTAGWRMEVWTQWTPVFQPGGELISRLFGRRVQQLSLPTRPLDVAHGMDSRVATLVDGDGSQRAAGWIRTLRSTGEYVFSGCYGTRTLPGADGAYVVVRDGARTDAARAPIHETFHVYVDAEGVLRTDHDLRMWGATVVRLHYKLERQQAADPASAPAHPDRTR